MQTSETLLLQDVWRKAYAQPDGLTITFKTKAGAVRARLQLYNAVRKHKRGEDVSDFALVRAAQDLEIVWAGPTSIRLQKRTENDMMQTLQAVVGKPVDAYQDEEVLEMEKNLSKLEQSTKNLKELEDMGLSGHQDNPFYGKRS